MGSERRGRGSASREEDTENKTLNVHEGTENKSRTFSNDCDESDVLYIIC